MNEPIAIVGIACRLPGNVTNMDDLWQMLAGGQGCWTKVPPDRYNEKAFLHPNPDFRGGYNHHGGHFLSQDLATFDAQFFGLSANEVKSMDPQQRLLLETSYEAFENGGFTLDSVRGSETAVYVASFSHDYDRITSKDLEDVPKYSITGVGEAIMSNRISYFFDLHGPSVTLDTGCSGSLVAVHQGAQSLRTRESDIALVAGVNLMLTPDHMISMSNFNMLNDEGKSFAFDSRGSGYGRGEGCVSIILKRLDDALQCKDPIHAVIRASGVNQDGRTLGITRPNGDAQAVLARKVCRNGRVDAEDVGYIEAHGTGTIEGDSAEITSIIQAYCTNRKTPLYVGSIKSNIGHLESASGLVGLLKAVLVLEKGHIPPQANFAYPKHGLRLEESNLKVSKHLQPWNSSRKRLVAVNSFGYGGTNAHVVLEENPEATRKGGLHSAAAGCFEVQQNEHQPYLIVVSAKSCASLEKNLLNLRNWIQPYGGNSLLANLAFTLSTRRTVFDWRVSLTASSSSELLETLDEKLQAASFEGPAHEPQVIFVFTGQGAQWAQMGRELLVKGSPFTASIVQSAKMLQRLGAGWDLIEELLRDEHTTRLSSSELAQPICTALQIALFELLANFKVRPAIVIGHSSGEIGAAYGAGTLSHESALKVAFHRGLLASMSEELYPSKGAMLAVRLAATDVESFIKQLGSGKAVVACVNSSSSTTVSGDAEAISELRSLLDSQSIQCRPLNVDTAYHSHHMQAVSERYLFSLKDLDHRTSRLAKFISTVTGSEMHSGFGAEYWMENLVSTVQYQKAVSNVVREETFGLGLADSDRELLFIEIGPHKVLARPTMETMKSVVPNYQMRYVSTLVQKLNAQHAILKCVGEIFEAGVSVDFSQIDSVIGYQNTADVISNLPPYAWDHREKYWLESRLSHEYRFRKHPYHALLGVRIADGPPLEPRWKNCMSIETHPWLVDHKVGGRVIFPGAAYIAMAMEAQVQLLNEEETSERHMSVLLKDVVFTKALIFGCKSERKEFHLSLIPRITNHDSVEKSWLEFRISTSNSKGICSEHCHGLIRPSFENQRAPTADDLNLGESSAGKNGDCKPDYPKSEDLKISFYNRLYEGGNDYGHTFQQVEEWHRLTADDAVGSVNVLDVASFMPSRPKQSYTVHPATLDALMHTSLPLYQDKLGKVSVMPISIADVRISCNLVDMLKPLRFHVKLTTKDDKDILASLSATKGTTNSTGELVVQMKDILLRGFHYAREEVANEKLPAWTTVWQPVTETFLTPKNRISVRNEQQQGQIIHIHELQSQEHMDCMEMFVKGLRSQWPQIKRSSWQNLHPDKETVYILIDDGDRPILANLNEQFFGKLTQLITSQAKILWISLSTKPEASKNPEKSLITGLARSAHAENDALQLITLDIRQAWTTCTEYVVAVAAEILKNFVSYVDPKRCEREFVLCDGQVMVPRILVHHGLTNWLVSKLDIPSHREDLRTNSSNTQLARTALVSNGVYIVAGGLGFLGRQICQLIACQGARHIVILSRRAIGASEEKRVTNEIERIAPTARTYCFSCDISKTTDLEQVKLSLDELRLPPVKGVIQSAVFLQDRTLSSMTFSDFNLPLQSKLQGTRNLSRLFNDVSLDFFVMLSSATATVGTRGQANYGAGNTFQDALAQSKAHYISVSPGIIEGADANNLTRDRNLRRHGLIPVSVVYLMDVIEYAMSPQAKLDGCNHVILGFSRHSLSQVQIRNANVHSAMFSHVFASDRTQEVKTSQPDTPSIKERSRKSEGIWEAVQAKNLIAEAVAKKLAGLVSAQHTTGLLHKALVTLGLDSLSTVELSDWISADFMIKVRPSDLMEVSSGMALVDLIYEKSDLFRKDSDRSSNKNMQRKGTRCRTANADENSRFSNDYHGPHLPLIPLPELERTLRLYLESLRCFQKPEELDHTARVVNEFGNGGYGAMLQERLQARQRDSVCDSWQNELYSRNIYLRRRDPIHPFMTFFGGHLLSQNPISQAKKAAIISAAAIGFREKMVSGNLAPDEMNGEPLCMESWSWLFNTCREPHWDVDRISRASKNHYLIALRRGHIFKISWSTSEGIATLLQLENAFERVRELSSIREPSVAALTADNRDNWALARQRLRHESTINDATISAIEAAAFVVCLDDESPQTPSERCNQFFLGNPANRWSDKNIQFIVCENGVSALVGEHSMIDGLSVRMLQRRITTAIQDHDMARDINISLNRDSDVLAKHLVAKLSIVRDNALETEIYRIQENFKQDFAPIEVNRHEFTEFGTDFLRNKKCPPKSGFQLVIQLACLLYYGYQPPSWETISMSRFHKGRVDWIQTVTPSVAAFCSSALDTSMSATERKKLLFEAADAHTNLINQIARGHGFKAHLHTLREVIQDNETLPEIFLDSAWEMTKVQSAKIVKTDCLEGMMLQETAFLLSEPECIFVHFEVKSHGCEFLVQTWEGKTAAVCEKIDEAAGIFRSIIDV